jgi:endoplasmic reticulum chaperone BiP
VSARDKASGKSQSITITSDKGRLSEDEIERMVKEAEEHAEADKMIKQDVEAKNQLESYLYNLKNSVTNTLKEQVSTEDKEAINAAVKDALAWLEEHPSAVKADYDERKESVEAIANPIIAQAYNTAASSEPGPEQDGDDAGPTVEEAD